MTQTPENDGSVCFLYGTVLGRGLLKIVQGLHLDRLAVWYLRSRLSKSYIARFAAKNGIALSREELSKFPTYRDFFLRERYRTSALRTSVCEIGNGNSRLPH